MTIIEAVGVQWVTADEAARRLRVNPALLRLWRSRGKLRSVKEGTTRDARIWVDFDQAADLELAWRERELRRKGKVRAVYDPPERDPEPKETQMQAETRRWREVASAVVITESGCWIPAQAPRKSGYVYVSVSAVPVAIYRLSLAQSMGITISEIPKGMVVDHVYDRGCRRTECCNPDHLELVTQKQNMERGVRARRNVCKLGHLLVGDNLDRYALQRGHRVCRECKNAYKRDARRAKREAWSCEEKELMTQ